MAQKAPRTAGKKPVKRNARSLHIGLNSVNPEHYEGWSGPLAACEFDANDMRDLAKARGIKASVLLTRDATRARTLAAIRAAAKALKAGDLFFLSYSGHGGQVDDVSGEDETDKLDETWCLFDGQLIDDELYFELTKFKKGVRIIVLSDSCHSGTVTRASVRPQPNAKLLPPDKAVEVYRAHKDFYDGLQRVIMKVTKSAPADPDAALAHVAVSGRLSNVSALMKAAVILISGCQDNQTSMDGHRNGAFTGQLLRVWDKGHFNGNYATFHSRIKAALPPTQSPNLFTLGSTAKFAAELPFAP
jgi:metacaspase-1